MFIYKSSLITMRWSSNRRNTAFAVTRTRPRFGVGSGLQSFQRYDSFRRRPAGTGFILAALCYRAGVGVFSVGWSSVTSAGIALGVGFILVLIGERGIRHWNRLFPSDFEPPPPPDVAQQPAFSGQRIVETVYSESKQGRVFITEDEAGIYQIMV